MPRVALSLFAALCAALALAACGGGGGTTDGGSTSAGTTGGGNAATGPETTSGGAETSTSGESTAPQKNEPPREITEPEESEASGESPAQAKAAIEKAIVTSVTGTDPSKCRTTEAPGFIEQTTGLSGEEAIAACEEQAKAGVSGGENVRVKSVEAVGESAVALVAINGGTLEGQTVEVAIRREGGNWRLGRLIGFKDFDRDAFLAAVGETLENEGGEVAASRSCVLRDLARVPTVEFENSILTGAAPGLVAAYESCQRQTIH